MVVCHNKTQRELDSTPCVNTSYIKAGHFMQNTIQSQEAQKLHYLITGANRGIGLELCKQALEKGHHVSACVRKPETATELRALEGNLRIVQLELSSGESINDCAEMIDGPIDVLINNAGIMGGYDQALHEIRAEQILETVNVNAIRTLEFTRALLPKMKASQCRKIVSLTSRMGSIADNTSGRFYAYRMSKAALNMAMQSLAIDLAPEQFRVLLMHPGWVQTDMGGANAPLNVRDSVSQMLGVITRYNHLGKATFMNYQGETLSW